MRAGVATAPRTTSPAVCRARIVRGGVTPKAGVTRASRLAVRASATPGDDMASGPSVLVVGGGRVGTYVACKFKSAGTTGEVVLKGSPVSRGVSSLQPFVDAMCAEAGVAFVRDYEAHRDRVFDFVFVSVKTYDLPSVKAELDAHGITPKIAILVHNGIVGPLFDDAVRVVIPQSYDFVEEAVAREDAETGQKKITVHVKNEEKPWVMPDTDSARAVATLLEASGMRAVADPAFAYGLIRKFFINGVANLLAIVGDCNCNGLLADHRARMERLYEEFVAVLAAPHADAFAMLPEDFHAVVFDGLASYGEHFPSTKMDFDAGRALEVDSLNGYVVAQARRQGVPAPENEKLVDEVAALVRDRDGNRDARNRAA